MPFCALCVSSRVPCSSRDFLQHGKSAMDSIGLSLMVLPCPLDPEANSSARFAVEGLSTHLRVALLQDYPSTSWCGCCPLS